MCYLGVLRILHQIHLPPGSEERFIFKYLLSVSILFYYATLIISIIIVYVVFRKK